LLNDYLRRNEMSLTSILIFLLQAIGVVILSSVLIVVVMMAIATLSALTGKLDGIDKDCDDD